MAEQKKTVYLDTRLIVGLIILLFGLVYVGAAWFPETVKLVFNIKVDGNAADGQFSGFGTIGDFFGGVINPILSFITIYLLLVSIRIQREELEETRLEMQAATRQARISANAAKASLKIAKISERPFLRFCSKEASQVVAHNFSRVTEDLLSFDLKLALDNIGKGTAVVKKIKMRCYLRSAHEKFYLESICSIPIKANDKEMLISGIIVKGKYGEIQDTIPMFFWEQSIGMTVEYVDSFNIEYSFFYEIHLKQGGRPSIHSSVDLCANWSSFEDRVQLDGSTGENNEGERIH